MYRDVLDRSLLTVKATTAQTLKSKVMHKHLNTHSSSYEARGFTAKWSYASNTHTYTHTTTRNRGRRESGMGFSAK